MRCCLALFLLAAACTDGAPSDTGDTDTDAIVACDSVDWQDCAWPSPEHAVAKFPESPDSGPPPITDASTGRELQVLVRAPVEMEGPLPVVVYSHGGGFAPNGQTLGEPWGEALAAHGVAVVHIGHAELTPDTRRSVCVFADVPPAECVPEDVQFGAIARPRDVIAVIDHLDDLSAWLVDEGGPSLDSDRVLTMGHSAGSQAGLVLAGAVRDIATSVPRYTDPDDRPVATIALSPQGPGFNGFFAEPSETSWDAVTRPTLMITGVNDINPGNPDLDGPTRHAAFDNLPGEQGDQFLLYSTQEAGNHGTFNLGTPGNGVDDPLYRLSQAMVSTVRAFVDVHVDDNAEARAWLASDAPQRMAGEAEWSSR